MLWIEESFAVATLKPISLHRGFGDRALWRSIRGIARRDHRSSRRSSRTSGSGSRRSRSRSRSAAAAAAAVAQDQVTRSL